MNVYIDIDGCCENDSLPGGRIVAQEVLSKLFSREGLSIVLLSYDAMSGIFQVLDRDKVLGEVAADFAMYNETGRKEAIDVKDIVPGSLFVDFGAAFGNGWRRTELYSRLHESGVRIASYVHDLAPYSNPAAFDSALVVSFLYFIGAVLQYSDLVIAPVRDIMDEIDVLRKTLGLGTVPEYVADPSRIADILANAAACPPLKRLANLFRSQAKKTSKSHPAEIHQDDLFPDYNVGAPIRLFLPCHEGISFRLGGCVWTEGKTVTMRMKVRGVFRRGLCLKMDFATLFNGRQYAKLYANETPIGEIEASGDATRTLPIPAACLGEDRKLTLRMELPSAIAPCEVTPASRDKRLLALSLFEMRLFDEDPYFACRAGEPLFFAEDDGAFAAQYCLEGISKPEKEFAWTDGDIVTMRFCPFDFNGIPKSITLHYKTFLPEEHIIVLVNDSEIANYVACGEETRTLSLPSNCLTSDGFVMVSVRLPDAVSPSELGRGPDIRRLALQLFSVVLE